MLVTIDWIKKNYDVYNKKCFDGVLPKNLEFKLSKSKQTWGYAKFRYDYANDTIIPLSITISNYYDSPEEVKLNTLIHEMIHIYDYVINPNHFIFNGRRVGRRYNAHGYWFLNQCDRLRSFGFDINPKVTWEEKFVSTLSAAAKAKEEKKSSDSLVVVISGKNANWMYKTNKANLAKSISSIKRYIWTRQIGEMKNIKVYSFDNARLANTRNSVTRLNGWRYSYENLMKRLQEIKATEVTRVKSLVNPVLHHFGVNPYYCAA
jgi:hypothetical protein